MIRFDFPRPNRIKGKAQVDDTTESVKAAVEAGKTAFAEKKSELTNIRSRDKEEEDEETS